MSHVKFGGVCAFIFWFVLLLSHNIAKHGCNAWRYTCFSVGSVSWSRCKTLRGAHIHTPYFATFFFFHTSYPYNLYSFPRTIAALHISGRHALMSDLRPALCMLGSLQYCPERNLRHTFITALIVSATPTSPHNILRLLVLLPLGLILSSIWPFARIWIVSALAHGLLQPIGCPLTSHLSYTHNISSQTFMSTPVRTPFVTSTAQRQCPASVSTQLAVQSIHSGRVSRRRHHAPRDGIVSKSVCGLTRRTSGQNYETFCAPLTPPCLFCMTGIAEQCKFD